MAIRLFPYLKHCITATNQHGVHSPFVYDYLVKCLYRKPRIKGNKAQGVLQRSIAYFGPDSIGVIGEDPDWAKTALQGRTGKAPWDLAYAHGPNLVDPQLLDFHNDSVLLINNIHASEAMENQWHALLALPKARVTIDLFHCGLVFFRKEQAAQHFKIRL